MMLLSAWIGFALLQNIDPCYIRISFLSCLTRPLIFFKAVSLDCVGFQYTSGNSRAVFVPAQGSHAGSCSRTTLSPQLDLFNDVQRSMLASTNVMIVNGSYLSSLQTVSSN
jgi:hypothetical protein